MPTPRARSSPPYLSRRRWTKEDARQALAALDKSGLKLTAFAINNALDPQRLTRWRRILSATPSSTFEEILPAVFLATGEEAPVARTAKERIEIVLPSGRIVRVPDSFDASALRRLLVVVEEEECSC